MSHKLFLINSTLLCRIAINEGDQGDHGDLESYGKKGSSEILREVHILRQKKDYAEDFDKRSSVMHILRAQKANGNDGKDLLSTSRNQINRFLISLTNMLRAQLPLPGANTMGAITTEVPPLGVRTIKTDAIMMPMLPENLDIEKVMKLYNVSDSTKLYNDHL
ncbi:hypothetical protein PanWU01x14_020090 [Parasponia andersonii]|uniref:Uncharacterized protein n=1 Tax=Parasponia andersonii TaxID=3476 RepID=A0A2P5DYJ2_PARAD|nr:hypothetical protein PanWU01x14_020090 [Parasponia andersonii]